jgi:hypothetical protein
MTPRPLKDKLGEMSLRTVQAFLRRTVGSDTCLVSEINELREFREYRQEY